MQPITNTAATFALLAGAMLHSAFASAHFFAESHRCKTPVMPLEFITDLDRQEFDAKVNEYRSCLETFVNKQNQATEKHREGAQKAADDWKSYAETVLKVKLKSSDAPATSQ